uniref:Transporter n=1 Tax=Strongyloides papillosus TaxID=174720 RepID=A0A0N5BMR5_STREA
MSLNTSQRNEKESLSATVNTLHSILPEIKSLKNVKSLRQNFNSNKSYKGRKTKSDGFYPKYCDNEIFPKKSDNYIEGSLKGIKDSVNEELFTNNVQSFQKLKENFVNQNTMDDSVYNIIFTRNFFKLASSVGIMLGLGNIWRFPMVVYENGGGTFIIIYLILCVIIGFPAAYMEGLLVQFSKSTPSFSFSKIVPIMKGLGMTGVMINMLTTTIYGVILSWITIYCGISLISKHRLIFSCKNSYNTRNCFSLYDNKDCLNNHRPEGKKSFKYNDTYFLPDGYQGGTCIFSDIDDQITDIVRLHYSNENYQAAGKEFFERFLLNKTDDLNNVGELNGTLVTTLALILAFTSYIIVLNSNKYKYFSNAISVASSFAVFIFMTQTLTMNGSQSALMQYFFNFDYKFFLSPKTWVNAAAQLCYSISIAEGSYIINLSLKNKKKNNIFKETIVILLCDIAMSLICTIAVFSVMGHLAYKYKLTSIKDLADYGAMLLFVAIPEGISENFAGNVYMLIFFAFTFVLVQSSLAYYIESIVCCIMNQFNMNKSRRSLVVELTAVVLFILSLPMTFGNGIYWVVAFDDAITTSLPILALIEIGTISYIYGIDRWMLDIKTILKSDGTNHSRIYGSSGAMIRYLWKYITPLSLLFICLATIYKIFNQPFMLGKYEMPNYAKIVGWIVGFAPFSCVLGFASAILLKSIIDKKTIPILVKVKPDWPTYSQDYQSKTKRQINVQRKHSDEKEKGNQIYKKIYNNV